MQLHRYAAGTLAACIATLLAGCAGTQPLSTDAVVIQTPRFAGDRDVHTPLVLEGSVQPIPFSGSDGLVHLDYELRITNTRADPASLVSLEVVDDATGEVLRKVEGAAVTQSFALMNGAPTDTLGAAQSGNFWIDVALPANRALPKALSHRLTVKTAPMRVTSAVKLSSDAQITLVQQGWSLPVSTERAVVIGPPLEGKNWMALNGCCNDIPHRRAGIPVNGGYYVAQRYAIDWNKLEDTPLLVATTAVAPNEAWATYGQRAIAVADATVVSILDNLPDRVPNALPHDTNMQNVTGNHVILDLGNSRYAFYAHIKAGSIQVKPGQQVKKGDVLGLVGNSGNTTGAHLHFHVSNGIGPLSSQGVPYVIDRYQVRGIVGDVSPAGKATVEPAAQANQQNSLPLNNTLVDF